MNIEQCIERSKQIPRTQHEQGYIDAICWLLQEFEKLPVLVEDVADLKKERDALKSALESLCNTGYSQPTSKAWTAAREVLKGLK